MINGVIFDMDGLMFDTERMWATFWEPALAALGLPYKEGLSEAARGTAGETLRNVVRQFYGQDCDAAAIVERIVAADNRALNTMLDEAAATGAIAAERAAELHDILAAANPHPFLRYTCELINEMIRQLIVFGNRTPQAEHRRFGEANAQFHRAIVQAARARDAEKVRTLMQSHMQDAASSVKRMKGRIQGRLILDADTLRRPRAAPAVSTAATAAAVAKRPRRRTAGVGAE